MRVLLAGQVDLSRPNGASLHQIGLAQGLAALGHEVTLLALGARPEGLDPRVETWLPRGDFRPGARLELELAARLLAARRPRFDAAHVRLSASSSALALAARARAGLLSVELNGLVGAQLARAGRAPWAIALVEQNLRGLLQVARFALAPSPRVLRYLESSLGAPRAAWIPNGVDVREAQGLDRETARSALGLPLDASVVACVTTLEHGLMLGAWARAAQALGARFVLAGDGPAEHALGLDGLGVERLGRVPHAGALALMVAADVCVCPHPEDLSMKALEHASLRRVQVVEPVEGVDWLESVAPARSVFVARDPDREATLSAALTRAREGSLAPPRAELDWRATAEALVRRW